MNELGKILMVLGFLTLVAGAVIWSGIGRGWIGHLPGDIHYSKGHTSFYFPLATCLIVTVALNVILWLLRKL